MSNDERIAAATVGNIMSSESRPSTERILAKKEVLLLMHTAHNAPKMDCPWSDLTCYGGKEIFIPRHPLLCFRSSLGPDAPTLVYTCPHQFDSAEACLAGDYYWTKPALDALEDARSGSKLISRKSQRGLVRRLALHFGTTDNVVYTETRPRRILLEGIERERKGSKRALEAWSSHYWTEDHITTKAEDGDDIRIKDEAGSSQ